MIDLLEGIGDGLLVGNGDLLAGELPVVVRCDDIGHFFLGGRRGKTELASTGKTKVVGVASLGGRDAAKDVNEHDSIRCLEARVHAEPDGDEGGPTVAGVLGVARSSARVAAWDCSSCFTSGIAATASSATFLVILVLVILVVLILLELSALMPLRFLEGSSIGRGDDAIGRSERRHTEGREGKYC